MSDIHLIAIMLWKKKAVQRTAFFYIMTWGQSIDSIDTFNNMVSLRGRREIKVKILLLLCGLQRPST